MAELLFDEDRLVAEATGNQPVLYNDVLVAVWRGQEAKATELLEAIQREASARGMGRFVSNLTYLESVLSTPSVDTRPHARPLGKHSSAMNWGSGH
jgi:hypothetical protein